MTARRVEVLVDVGPSSARDLFAPEAEFAGAWRGLRERNVALPFEVVVHLYAYEFLERLRECAAEVAAVAVHAPFWPGAMFVAGDVHAHAGDDLAALHPALDVTWRRPSVADVATSALTLFGCVPFDPAVYVDDLAACAAREGWRLR